MGHLLLHPKLLRNRFWSSQAFCHLHGRLTLYCGSEWACKSNALSPLPRQEASSLQQLLAREPNRQRETFQARRSCWDLVPNRIPVESACAHLWLSGSSTAFTIQQPHLSFVSLLVPLQSLGLHPAAKSLLCCDSHANKVCLFSPSWYPLHCFEVGHGSRQSWSGHWWSWGALPVPACELYWTPRVVQ